MITPNTKSTKPNVNKRHKNEFHLDVFIKKDLQD